MFHFKHPFAAIVAGPSGCGKSIFVYKFTKQMKQICNKQFQNIVWCYAEMHPLYNIDNIDYCQGIPVLNMFDENNPQLIIIDDLLRESDARVVDIFIKGSDHRNLRVFYLSLCLMKEKDNVIFH